jgi:prepilin peptidase CpaA
MIFSMTLWLKLAPLIGVLIAAAITDLRDRRIPNVLTLSLLAAGLCRGAMLGSWAGLGHASLGMLAGAAIPLFLFAISALGGGDVKLMAAIGAWVGAGPVLMILAVEAVLGLVIVLFQAVSQRRTGVLFRNSALIAANFACLGDVGMNHVIETGKQSKSVQRPLPFAVPVLIATLLVLYAGSLIGR